MSNMKRVLENLNEWGDLKAYRCQLCDYVYIGNTNPDRCPHCGVNGVEMKVTDEWKRYEEVEDLTGDLRDKVERALELEMEDETYYRGYEDKATSDKFEAYFRRLGRHEGKHVHLLEDVLGIEDSDYPDLEIPDSKIEMIENSLEREGEAIDFYRSILSDTNNYEGDLFRINYIFNRLIEVERDHKQVLNKLKSYLTS